MNAINSEITRQMEIVMENIQAQINALKKTLVEAFHVGHQAWNLPRLQGNYQSIYARETELQPKENMVEYISAQEKKACLQKFPEPTTELEAGESVTYMSRMWKPRS